MAMLEPERRREWPRGATHGGAMMGVELDGTILLLVPAAQSANLRLRKMGMHHRSGRRGN